LDCSNIASSSINFFGYIRYCKGFTTGNACNPTSRYSGPRASKTGAMACTKTDPNHTPVPSDCPPGSFGFGNGFTFGCYPCEAGTSRTQSDALTTCSPCSVGLVSGKGSGTCNNVCPAGKGATKKKAACANCSPKYYNDGNHTSCLQCPG